MVASVNKSARNDDIEHVASPKYAHFIFTRRGCKIYYGNVVSKGGGKLKSQFTLHGHKKADYNNSNALKDS